MSERSSALLTKSQREGLLEGLGTSSSERKLRQRMRARIRDSTKDLRLLFTQLDDEEIENTFRTNLTRLRDYHERLEETMKLLDEIDEHSRKMGLLDEYEYMFKDYLETLNKIESLDEKLESISSNEVERGRNNESLEEKDRIEGQIEALEDDLRSIEESLISHSREVQEVIREITDLMNDVIDDLSTIEKSSTELRLYLGDDTSQFLDIIQSTITEHNEIQEELEEVNIRFQNVEQFFPDRPSSHADIDTVDQGLVNYLSNIQTELEEYREKYGRRRHRYSRRRLEGPGLRSAMHILERNYRKKSFPPEMRDDVVKAIGFYLRIVDASRADLETVLDDAITHMVSRYRDEEVLESVSVNIDVSDREQALERGQRRLGGERLSNAELRALVESNTDILVEHETLNQYSLHDRLFERLLENPDLLGSGFKFKDIEPSIEYRDLSVQVDLLGEDQDGTTTLVEIETDPSENFTNEIERMRILVDAADKSGGEVQGIIVSPESIVHGDTSQISATEPQIDVRLV